MVVKEKMEANLLKQENYLKLEKKNLKRPKDG